MLSRGQQGDAHWPWRKWVPGYGRGYRKYAVHVEGVYQGFMVVRELDWLRGTEGGHPCCYLELIAAAPWNRAKLREKIDCGRPRITPVGSCLLWRAVRLSVELGYQGRLAWHSLEGALDNYEGAFKDGLENLGEDYEKGLPWLEIGSRAAAAFQSRMEPFIELGYGVVGGSEDLV